MVIFSLIGPHADVGKIDRIPLKVHVFTAVSFVSIAFFRHRKRGSGAGVQRIVFCQKVLQRVEPRFADGTVRKCHRKVQRIAVLHRSDLCHFHIGNGFSARLIIHPDRDIIAKFQISGCRLIAVGIGGIFLFRRNVDAGIASVLFCCPVFVIPKLCSGGVRKLSGLVDIPGSAEKARKRALYGFPKVIRVGGCGLWDLQFFFGLAVIDGRPVRSVMQPDINRGKDLVNSAFQTVDRCIDRRENGLSLFDFFAEALQGLAFFHNTDLAFYRIVAHADGLIVGLVWIVIRIVRRVGGCDIPILIDLLSKVSVHMGLLLFNPECVKVKNLVQFVTVFFPILYRVSGVIINADDFFIGMSLQRLSLTFLDSPVVMASRGSAAVVFSDKAALRQKPFFQTVSAEFQFIRDRDLTVLIGFKRIRSVCRDAFRVRQQSSVVF